MAFALKDGARLSLSPLARAHSRRGRLRLTLRTARLLPLEGLLTLGFGPARFQTEPPACYRAPWRLPGPDSHRLATTSFRSSQVTSSSTSPSRSLGALPVPVEFEVAVPHSMPACWYVSGSAKEHQRDGDHLPSPPLGTEEAPCQS